MLIKLAVLVVRLTWWLVLWLVIKPVTIFVATRLAALLLEFGTAAVTRFTETFAAELERAREERWRRGGCFPQESR